MSAQMNKVILAGNLAREPEVRDLSGTSVCVFTLAVSERFKTRDGQQRERVLFIDCEAWNATGEVCGKYLHKGSGALVEGKLIQETWEDKQTGAKRSKFSLRVENVQFLGASRKAEDGGASDSVPAPVNAQATDDEEMPF